jgi:putative transposase
MMDDPSEYAWSSYQINALGKISDLCTPHPEYLRLGETQNERMENYRALFSCHVEGDLLEDIRLSSVSQKTPFLSTVSCLIFKHS